MIKLFNINNGVITPTEHCYTLSPLKDLMEEYPEDYLAIYQFIFYMTCPNDEENPFFNLKEEDKEEIILKQLNPNFSTDCELIENGLKLCNTLYDTPVKRAYEGIKTMLDNMAEYMKTTKITGGRDGNITALVNAAAKFDAITGSYKGAYRDLQKEQKVQKGRGGTQLAYDQID